MFRPFYLNINRGVINLMGRIMVTDHRGHPMIDIELLFISL